MNQARNDHRLALRLFHGQQRLTSRHASRLGRAETEDLASEAILRGWRQQAPDGHDDPWIERIFRNLLIDRRRRGGAPARLRGPSLIEIPRDFVAAVGKTLEDL